MTDDRLPPPCSSHWKLPASVLLILNTKVDCETDVKIIEVEQLARGDFWGVLETYSVPSNAMLK